VISSLTALVAMRTPNLLRTRYGLIPRGIAFGI
jgi:hypothetical protein